MLVCVLIASPSLANEFTWKLEQRVRYETINDSFRVASDSDDLVMSRTILGARYARGGMSFTAEFLDARVWGADADTRLNPGMVNTAELVEGYASFKAPGWQIDVGQMTREDSTRRILARNLFRNSTNFFRGLDVYSTGDRRLRAFYLFANQPGPSRDLRDNPRVADSFTRDYTMAGLSIANEGSGWRREFGIYRLEDNRFRVRRRDVNSASAEFEFDRNWLNRLHTVIQWGDRQNGPRSRNVRSFFQHVNFVSVGLKDSPLDGSIVLDVARGDADPDDDRVETFDTLFGVQRFEWGPGSLFAAFRRSNVISPALRVRWREGNATHYIALRPVWLYSKRDAWQGTVHIDQNGNSGRFVGTLLDARFRWAFTTLSYRLRLELGGALLKRGQFARARGVDDDTTYAYVQLSVSV